MKLLTKEAQPSNYHLVIPMQDLQRSLSPHFQITTTQKIGFWFQNIGLADDDVNSHYSFHDIGGFIRIQEVHNSKQKHLLQRSIFAGLCRIDNQEKHFPVPIVQEWNLLTGAMEMYSDIIIQKRFFEKTTTIFKKINW